MRLIFLIWVKDIFIEIQKLFCQVIRGLILGVLSVMCKGDSYKQIFVYSLDIYIYVNLERKQQEFYKKKIGKLEGRKLLK